jgi:hypothetical protein
VTDHALVSRFDLESEYDEFIALLRREKVGWRKRESREKWIARLSDAMQRVWAKLFAPPAGEWKTVRIGKMEEQLPPARSRGIARDLVDRCLDPSDQSDRLTLTRPLTSASAPSAPPGRRSPASPRPHGEQAGGRNPGRVMST